MGFLDADIPTYSPPSIAPGTHNLLDSMAARDMAQSAGDIASQKLADTDTSALINHGDDNGLYSALKSKYDAPYRFQQEAQNNSAQWNARQQKFQQTVQVSGLLEREKQINDQIALMQQEADKQKRAARARIVGQLVGVGAIGAGLAIGGPAGAAVAAGGAAGAR